MKSMKIITTIAVILLLAVNVLPALAAASTVNIVIDNRTNDSVTVTLSGEQRYTFTAAPGKTRQQMAQGTYHYYYFGCNQSNYGTFLAKPPRSTLVLDCPDDTANEKDLVQLKINNRSGETVYLSLWGAAYYYFSLKPGQNTVTLKAGSFQYAYSACGERQTGSLKVSGKTTRMTIDKCEAPEAPTLFRVRVVNRTEGDITMWLYGPKYYVFNVPEGKSLFMVEGNTYFYSVMGTCDGIREVISRGTQSINRSITWTWSCK
jgi:hypothetical protein